MSAGGAGAGFTVSTGEAALSRLLSSIIIVACSGAAMLCYRAPSHTSLLWMMLSVQEEAGCFPPFLPLSTTAREEKDKNFCFYFCFSFWRLDPATPTLLSHRVAQGPVAR